MSTHLFRMLVGVLSLLSLEALAAENAEWNAPSRGPEQSLDSVLGVRGDENGIIWMMDAGTRGKVTPKLVAWNTGP